MDRRQTGLGFTHSRKHTDQTPSASNDLLWTSRFQKILLVVFVGCLVTQLIYAHYFASGSYVGVPPSAVLSHMLMMVLIYFAVSALAAGLITLVWHIISKLMHRPA